MFSKKKKKKKKPDPTCLPHLPFRLFRNSY